MTAAPFKIPAHIKNCAGNQGYNILHHNMVRVCWVEGEDGDGNMQPQSNSRQALLTAVNVFISRQQHVEA